jgi:hypothetical protein
MSIEAMKFALEALEDIFGKNKVDVGAINALREAIAEAEKQEPVAWMDAEGDVYRKEPPEGWCPPHKPLYTYPPHCKCGVLFQDPMAIDRLASKLVKFDPKIHD